MEISFKKEIKHNNLDGLIENVTQILKAEGFGILTRINFHEKMKEKLDKDLRPTIILGACNPQMAYEAFLKNTDIAALVPCNVVIREINQNLYSVEIIKPSALMKILNDKELESMALRADEKIKSALASL